MVSTRPVVWKTTGKQGREPQQWMMARDSKQCMHAYECVFIYISEQVLTVSVHAGYIRLWELSEMGSPLSRPMNQGEQSFLGTPHLDSGN